MPSIAEATGTTGQAGFACQAAEAIADALTREDLDVQLPGQARSSFLQVTNVPGTLCELTIYDSGLFDWQCHYLNPGLRDPSALAATILCILTGETSSKCPPVIPDLRLTTTSQTGQALARQGMQVRLNLLDRDKQLFEIYTEIAVTNPERPSRGTVSLTEDGVIRWHSRLRNPEDPESGLGFTELTGTLARVLTTAAAPGAIPVT